MSAVPKPTAPSQQAYACAAWALACEVAAIMAVAEVESGPYGPFLPTGEPVILYEPHIFSRLTRGAYDGHTVKGGPADGRVLSHPSWRPGTYGKMSAQHAALQEAAKLNRDAALQSCSWGMFQVLGVNYKRCGHETIQHLVTAAYADVESHLRMFVNFILSDAVMASALRMKNWPKFAERYNGTGYRANKYDEKMAAAYARLAKK